MFLSNVHRQNLGIGVWMGLNLALYGNDVKNIDAILRMR